MAKSMNNKDINDLLSGKTLDTDQRVLYEEKIDLGELHNTVFGFYDNAMAKMNQSKEMINTIEGEFAKINNSKKFYYGGDAAHQHGNLSIASQHFDDLQTVSPIFNDPASMTRMAELFNKTLVEKKHKVRVTLCQQKIDAINENRTVVETRTEKKLSNGILPDKTVPLDDIYEENYHYIFREALDDGTCRLDCTITKRIHIIDPATQDSVVTENNVKEMEQKVQRTGNDLPYTISDIVDYDD